MKKNCKWFWLVVFVLLCTMGFSTKSYAASYSGDYRYWSQGSSDYPLVRQYGCWVAAQAKMLYEAGVDRSASFNPDTYAVWEVNNGLLPNLTNDLNQIDGGNAPVIYASQKGKNLEYLGYWTSTADQLWFNINAGYYTIVKISEGAHYVFIDNEMSKATGQLYCDDSSSDNSYQGPRLLSSYGTWTAGYVYKTNGSNLSLNSVELGSSFDAYIIQSYDWKHLTVNDNNVEVASANVNSAKQQWHFERQSDGSYIITSLYDGRALDVYNGGNVNGTNVGLCGQWGDDNGAQRWYILGNAIAYRLVPKCAQNKSLDCAGGSTAPGTNIQIYDWNQTEAQVFSIYKVDDIHPSSISMEPVTVEQGKEAQMNVNFTPSNTSDTQRGITWESSDTSIATVNSDGTVAGVSPGEATITATSVFNDRIFTSATVTVKSGDTVAPMIKSVKVINVAEYIFEVELEVWDNVEVTGISNYRIYTNADPALGTVGFSSTISGYSGVIKNERKTDESHIKATLDFTNLAAYIKSELCGEYQTFAFEIKDSNGNISEPGYSAPFCYPVSEVVELKAGETYSVADMLPEGKSPLACSLVKYNESVVQYDSDREIFTALMPGKAYICFIDYQTCELYSRILSVISDAPVTPGITDPKPTPVNPPSEIRHKHHIGQTFVVGNLKYKVTKDDGAGREVRVTSLKKKVSTLTIPKTVTNTQWKETFKVTSIKAKAFKNQNFKKAVIGANVTKIGPNAFINCKNLKTVKIGKSVKTVGIRAFYGCSKLKKVIIKSQVLKMVKKNAFKRISKKAVIKVPAAKKQDYKKLLKGKTAKGVTIK